MMSTFDSILSKAANGRHVKIWEYQGVSYFNFLSWRNMKFDEDLNHCVSGMQASGS